LNTSKLNIIIAGYIVGGPLGGLSWHHLQYVLGLHKLGYNVLFVEDSDDYPSCYNPQTNELSQDPAYGLQFINELFKNYDLQHNWAYFHQPSDYWYGVSKRKVYDFISKADLFVNLSGVNPLREEFLKIPIRVFIDTDPVFTQVRHLTESVAFNRAKKHNLFFTYGENFGKLNCSIPDDGFNWQPTRQPVFLKAWKYSQGNKNAKWTTVMQWDSYKSREYNGKTFGMKSSSFQEYMNLPGKLTDNLELAIGSATAPKQKLSDAGWHIVDPLTVTFNQATYQHYLQQSKGEWSIAKHGYVSSYSGWFSERSTGYLSSGRPVVVQETGFSEFIHTGRGLFSFNNLSEAIAAIEEVNRNYSIHCKSAKAIVEEYFRSDKVLTSLLHNCNIHTPIIIKQ